MQIKLSLVSLALTIACHSPYAAVPISQDIAKQLQLVVDDYYQTHKDKEKFTGIAASVLIPTDTQLDPKDIHTFVAGTIGFAPATQKIEATNLFEIGSITKSFTALILLQLQTEGSLSLNDPLGKWLPEYPQWKDVTLRKLLNMTSGIPNYSNDPVFLKLLYGNLGRTWTNKELLTYAHPEKPITTNPDKLFDYSNSNYILAALVIEKVTQDTFENQLNKRILLQRDIFKNTFYPAGPDGKKIKESIMGRLVHGYFYDEATNQNISVYNDDLSWAGAAGAMVSTTEDVVRWVQVLYHGVLIKPTFRERALAELESVVSMKTGQPITTVTEEDPSGFGLGVGYSYDKKTKERFWFYEGSTLGFRVMYLWQPCNDITTVVAINSKAAEGGGNSMGDDIIAPNLALYRTVLLNYPTLRCES